MKIDLPASEAATLLKPIIAKRYGVNVKKVSWIVTTDENSELYRDYGLFKVTFDCEDIKPAEIKPADGDRKLEPEL